MRPAASYQSPSMTPPNKSEILVTDNGGFIMCGEPGCPEYAVGRVGDCAGCQDHVAEWREWDRADDQNKVDREEYGQYETDNSVG